ncbi:unnamed protein product [Adineta ricciae]|uniref:ADP ribosyltransferase domain-containing protein n=1 Tax=Adineta ricciae TaxID=249248 RepID=A0A815VW69_ADIRI|nr:unnamed protein product [Adineta ricciae]CAF1533244.1 unnamed protein product [Adineta ricciae]
MVVRFSRTSGNHIGIESPSDDVTSMANEFKSKEKMEYVKVIGLMSSEYRCTEEAKTLIEQIETVVNCTKVYENLDECEKNIRGTHGQFQSAWVFLIVTHEYIESILQRGLHDVRAIHAIFILIKDVSFSAHTADHDKVKGIFSNETDLLKQLFRSISWFSNAYRIVSSTLAGDGMDMTTNIVNNIADYSELWFPLFIDFLLDLPLSKNAKKRKRYQLHFVNQCRRFYAGNEQTLHKIDQFLAPKTGYSSKKALRFYTHSQFLYERVNRALRQKNILGILDFRFFLIDMRKQLQRAYSKFSTHHGIGKTMTLYRGQRMSSLEFARLQEKRRSGSLVTVNSYLSTSMEKDVAILFATGLATSQIIPVLFEIQAELKDSRIVRRKPFALICSYSQFPEEKEVLFSIGSFFRIHDVHYDETHKLYIVRMTFIYDEESSIITNDYTELCTCSLEEKLIKTGNLLSNYEDKQTSMKTRTFYEYFLYGRYSLSIKSACYIGLGWLAFKQNQPDEAIGYQQKALEITDTLHQGDYLKSLVATSYNSIGAVYRQQNQYDKALDSYKKADAKGRGVVRINKYEVYNSFNNSASMNIAVLEILRGFPEQAWSTYKKIVAHELNGSERFRAAVYVKIVEAGFSNTTNPRLMSPTNVWERFLELSFNEMSASYRRSIISGTFSICFRIKDSPWMYDKVAKYMEKLISVCQKFERLTVDEHVIVLQCHCELAQLYQQQHHFAKAIDHVSNGIKLCREHDSEELMTFYQLLGEISQRQLQEYHDCLRSDDICSLILDPSNESHVMQTHSTQRANRFEFRPNEFAFGQYKKKLSPAILKETQFSRRITYCSLKLAALLHEDKKVPWQRVKDLLDQALSVTPDDVSVQLIHKHNMLYVNKDFDTLISLYEQDIEDRSGQSSCIDEDAFCYVAHLYKEQGNQNQEEQWYKRVMQRFEEHQYVCQHTRMCFSKAALFYQSINDRNAFAFVYQRLVHHLLHDHHKTPLLQRFIVATIETIILPVTMVDSKPKDTIICEHLVELAMKQPDDFLGMHEEFEQIIHLCRNHVDRRKMVICAYCRYLEVLFTYTQPSSIVYVQQIRPSFEAAIRAYERTGDLSAAIETYQSFTRLMIKYSHSREHIIDSFKELGFTFEKKRRFDEAIVSYEALDRFLHVFCLDHPCWNDAAVNHILQRYQILIDSENKLAPRLYKKMIGTLLSYKQKINIHYDTTIYLKNLQDYYLQLAKVEPDTAPDTYCDLLELLRKHRPERIEQHMSEIVHTLQSRPQKLLILLQKFYIDYTPLIREVHKRLLNRSPMFEPFSKCPCEFINETVSSFTKKAKRLAQSSKGQEAVKKLFRDCIIFLLELKSISDERFATCYLQLGDSERAAAVFDPNIYCDLANQYCPSAVRRYSKFISPLTSDRTELERRSREHFHHVDDQVQDRSLKNVI